jgi:hypothetical protein
VCALPILEKELRRRGKKIKKKWLEEKRSKQLSTCFGLCKGNHVLRLGLKELVHTTIFMGGSRYSTIP